MPLCRWRLKAARGSGKERWADSREGFDETATSVYNACRMGSAEAEQLRQFLAALAIQPTARATKAELFQQFASDLEARTGGTWQAARIDTTDGGTAFVGRQGEIVVFAPDGSVFRGRLGSYRPTLEGIELDYSKLAKL